MSITGRLQEFSLPEVFKVIDEGCKSGLLNIRVFDHQLAEFNKYYIWISQGKIVGLSNNLDGQDLINYLVQESIVAPAQQAQLKCIPADLQGLANLGDYLQQQNWVSSEQLQNIFETVVIQSITDLFQVHAGFFTFHDNMEIPKTELTGLSMAATTASLVGLQNLTDWTHFADKLPEASAGIVQTGVEFNLRQLSDLERQTLGYANGKISIQRSAQLLNVPIEDIQQIAFRLIAARLAEELPMVSAPSTVNLAELAVLQLPTVDNPLSTAAQQRPLPTTDAATAAPPLSASVNPGLSNAFLNNLTSFLHGRMKSIATTAAQEATQV